MSSSNNSQEVVKTSKRTRYAAVGTGGRIPMFIDPLVRDFIESGELVGLCDISQARMDYHRERLTKNYGAPDTPTYPISDFLLMIQETKPDVVIVCTTDATHHEYIIAALEAGCDVITEKPMTTDEAKCAAILEAVQRTGRKVRVTFNYRWTAGTTKVRELLQNGTIGRIHAVNLEYQLNTSHGADYFRRWHAHKEHSGGLLIHKSTHHFDLVNWWLNSIPSEVFAWGDLKFYGRENAIQRGDEQLTTYERYEDAPSDNKDPFYFALTDEPLQALYGEKSQAETGYIRNKNVFRDGISIEDTMSVLVKYRGGEVLNYSLVAYSPQEGFRVTFTGDRGRIEYTETHAAHVITGSSDVELGEEQSGHSTHLRVIPHFQKGYDVEIVSLKGGHGGGDPLIQQQIFAANPPEEIYGRNAGHEQGAASMLIGAAANRSMNTGLPIKIEDLCPLKPEAVRLEDLT
jgi:predicted dehydrogenase